MLQAEALKKGRCSKRFSLRNTFKILGQKYGAKRGASPKREGMDAFFNDELRETRDE